jgi:hypothetical protein
MQIMSSFLIIFRIAQGKAWSHEMAVTLTQAQDFPTQTIGGTNRSTGRSAGIHIQTHTTTTGDVLDGRGKESITLQVLKEAHTVDFDQAMTRL